MLEPRCVNIILPEGAKGPRKLGKGYFALQQHDPTSSARFRHIKVKRLP